MLNLIIRTTLKDLIKMGTFMNHYLGNEFKKEEMAEKVADFIYKIGKHSSLLTHSIPY